MVETFLCPSYYDDQGVLQDCKCGKCEEREREYRVHKAHCFMVVQPENEFMGCKYGRDEDCPVRKPYPKDPISSDHRNSLLRVRLAALEQAQRYESSPGDLGDFQDIVDVIDRELGDGKA